LDTANLSVEAEATTQNKNKQADLTKSPKLNRTVNAALTILEAELTLIIEELPSALQTTSLENFDQTK
jgi:hypothetical protein